MSAMLRSLRIRNLALVEELDWTLHSGFTAITGETGAGKSIIIGALSFLLGDRADRSLVRTGSTSAGIEAVFDLGRNDEVAALLEERGIDPCQDGELILKRTITSEGSGSGGRQFVNGCACNLSMLKDLGVLLIDLHGPHDHQSLFSRREQTLLLDRFCDALGERDDYLKCRSELSSAQREMEQLESDSGGEERLEQLRNEVDEITSANLSESEEESLLCRYRAASNSRRLIELSAGVVSRIEDDEQGAALGMAESARLLKELMRIDERASSYLEEMERLIEGLNALASDLKGYAENIELDAQEFLVLEERMNVIATLRRKYGPGIADIIARGTRSSEELERLSSLDSLKIAARERYDHAKRLTIEAAGRLSVKRIQGVGKLSKTVERELADLGFKQAGFDIKLEPHPDHGPDGCEVAEFLFAPNLGEPAQPLRAIASSGEISRVMLALKSALANQDRIPLLVFDEIDANVGGEIATKVAFKMRQLGESHQVLCITHLPQVAACGRTQFVVTKSVKEGRSGTILEAVDGDERVREIARMLGGVTDSAMAHATTLLKEGSILIKTKTKNARG
jgi:DNA repair protein RecN (Recombination protein N)